MNAGTSQMAEQGENGVGLLTAPLAQRRDPASRSSTEASQMALLGGGRQSGQPTPRPTAVQNSRMSALPRPSLPSMRKETMLATKAKLADRRPSREEPLSTFNLQKLKAFSRGWTPDRGRGFYSQERNRKKRPSLVETGMKAGKSRVRYTQRELLFIHQWTRDFFISALNTKLWILILIITLVYLATFFIFAGIWWGVYLNAEDCITNIQGFPMAFLISVATQQTIGYGNSAPNNCWGPVVVVTAQTLVGVFLDAVVIGVIFARISHPKYRGRTIAISDSAVIARRDGILKFMFRVADFRRTPVVEPKAKAYLYTWGQGRTTSEGEFIPVRVEELNIGYIDGMLLLPLIIEHTIDERSPLIGHTFESLMAADAEIIVTFEATTEFGNPFLTRQSYLPNEIHWGHQFAQMIHAPADGGTNYIVDISRLHDVEPQEGLEMMPPVTLSRLVVGKAMRTVPYPLLGENTLAIADTLVLAPDENGDQALMFRVGDTYPNQHLEVVVRCYLYRWKVTRKPGESGMPSDYDVTMLEVGYEDGRERLLLWLPVIGKHVITPTSPIASWATPGGLMADADAAIVVVVEGYQYASAGNRMRLRMFNVLDDVKRDHAFAPIVTCPSESPDYKPRINWSRFHETMPLEEAARTGGRATVEDLQRVSSMPLEDYSGQGKPMGELAERLRAQLAEGLARSHRTLPPEASHTHLTPDTDPSFSTFSLRRAARRPRVDRGAFEQNSLPSLGEESRHGGNAHSTLPIRAAQGGGDGGGGLGSGGIGGAGSGPRDAAVQSGGVVAVGSQYPSAGWRSSEMV
ncbi:hypothetical protein WJX81_000403 [Elliptochloris bilobata]|uniref:Uncharacterized protein n=1 Tax=Elliptochloris bilobata TaxID=381761 RepID=A0AAW1QV69_9CHLO